MTTHTSRTLATLLAAAAAAVALAACDRGADDRTAGQKLDGAVAQAEQKAAEVQADVKAAGNQARDATANAVESVTDKAKDAAITAAINAELTKDSTLSALRIDVDTVDGRVVLHGSAPDAAARERAATLSAAVDGVKSVDNQLVVGARN